MSYPLAVWEGSAPSTEREAKATYQDLMTRYHSARMEPTAAIDGFLTALLERWPDIGTPGGEDSPWADGPMANNASGPILYFAMIIDALPEAVPVIVEEAEKRGLVCFDPQGPPFVLRSEEPGKTRKPSALSRPTLRQHVSDALVEQGYQRKRSIHIRSINPDFCSYVDTGELRKGVATIKPWVGLHHHGVQRLLAELHEREPQDEEFSATIAANVGYVLDGVYRDWIDPTSPDGAVLLKAGRPKVQNAAQAAAVAGIGRPGTPSEVMSAIDQACKILDGYADLRKLPEARRIRGSLVQPHFTLVAIYLLLGDEVSACRWLVEGDRMDCQQEGPVCEQFRRFERNALARMSADAPAELERQRVEASKPAQTAAAVGVIGRLFGRKPKHG